MNKSRVKKLVNYVLKGGLIAIALAFLFIAAIYLGLFGRLPSKTDLQALQQENASLVYSEDNVIIGKFFAKNRTQVDSASVPQYVLDALVATEDKRFYEHNGVDFLSYLRVLIKTILMGNSSAGGGSTITQQFAKNYYGRGDYSLLSYPVNKTKEAIIAYRLEKVYSKRQILLLYLNTVPFGENTYGIEAASQRYFNCSTEELTIQQGALLIGMLKGNTIFNPRLHPEEALERRNTVLALMRQQNFLDSNAALEYQNSELTLDYTNYELYNPSGYFVERVELEAREILDGIEQKTGVKLDLEKDGLNIHTTLNFQLQKLALKAVQEQLERKQPLLRKKLAKSYLRKKWEREHADLLADTTTGDRYVYRWADAEKQRITRADSLWHYYTMLHAGALAVDPNSGAVRVWIGGNNSRFLPYDLVLAERQSASSYKPILYAAALESGISPCDYLSNEPTVFEEFNNWSPQNYDGESGGEVAMWYALAKSLNIPTVNLYERIGHSHLELTSGALGLPLPKKYLPAYALGTNSYSLWQMTQAYAAFANQGYRTSPYLVAQITDKEGNVIYRHSKERMRKAMSEESAAQLNQMLVTAVRNGTGRSMASVYGVKSALAGKTGTSQNYSDAWFFSYNRNLVFGVWVGAMQPEVHFHSGSNGSGSALALPIAGMFWRDIERNSVLRRQYAVGFPRDYAVTDTFDCPGIYDPTFFERIFGFGGEDDDTEAESSGRTRGEANKEDEDDGWLKRTWKKVFKKK